MRTDPEFLGRYMRLISTKEIVEVIAYNKETVDVDSKVGLRTIGRIEVERITAEEQAEYLRSQDSI